MTKSANKYLAALGFVLITLITIGSISRFTPMMEDAELKAYDFLLAVLRGPLQPPDDIVIVAIDDPSIAEFEETFGVSLPWPRSIHADLVKLLNHAGAKVIVFDVVFLGPTLPQDDSGLAEAIRSSSAPVIVAAAIDFVEDPRFTMAQELLPLEELIESGAYVGFATLNPDRDGVLRQGRLTVAGEPSLSTQAFQQVIGELDWSQLPIIDYEGDDPEILINYVGGQRKIPTVSYYQALDYATSLPEGVFQDKLVYVGYSLALSEISRGSTPDHYPTPFNIMGGGAIMAGVEIQATILNTLLTGDYLYRVSLPRIWGAMVALAILISLLVLSVQSFRLKILSSIVLIFGFVAFASMVFVIAGIWVYIIQPVAVMLMTFGLNTLYQYRVAEKERTQVRRALSGYVSSQVMNEILKDPDRLELGGKQLEATVLFTDIAGFSKISEEISPQELASLLNDYFTRMGDIIMARDGMINKFIGDAIMAIWNAPLPNPNHAVLACHAALDMQRTVASMAPIRMRIGVSTGPMIAGNIGHRERMEYTVIGDTVNLASRLEGANKAFGTKILVGEFTESLVHGSFLLRRVDRIRVMGRDHPVSVYEVMASLSEESDQELAELVASFESILELYETRNWSKGRDLARKHLERFPEDPVAKVYHERFRKFSESPPPGDWDGVFELESK